MVVVRASHRRGALVMLFAAIVFAALAGIAFWSASLAPVKFEPGTSPQVARMVRAFLFVLFLVMLLLTLPVAIFFGVHALYSCFGRTALILNADGLLFPVVPGARSGRLIRWEQICAIHATIRHDVTPSWLFGYSRFLFGPAIMLSIEAAGRPGSTYPANRLLRALYWANDLFSSPPARGRQGTTRLVEMLYVDRRMPAQSLLDLFRRMQTDAESRREYCLSDRLFEVRAGADGAYVLAPLHGGVPEA